jgi:uncharacterized protein (TIGR04255 family)
MDNRGDIHNFERSKVVTPVQPFNEQNAIELVGFVVTFARMLNEHELERLMGLKETLKDDLPIANQIQSISFAIDGAANKSHESSAFGGLVLQAKTENKLNIGWELRIDGNAIRVTCREYDRWHNVWPKARKFITECFVFLDTNNLAIAHFGCQITDKFVYQEDPQNYALAEVLNTRSCYLTDKLRSQEKQAWHINQGWFDDADDDTYDRWLNQLTVMSGYISEKLTTSINHIGQATFESPRSIDNVLALGGNGRALMDDTFAQFHVKNKLILAELLSEASKKQISLN